MMRQRILWGSGAGSVKAAIAEIRQYAMEQLKDIRAVLREPAPSARLTLSRHVNQIVMGPTPVVIGFSILLKVIGICSENTKGGLAPP
jgi:hypothetical protein